jgi:hypothetical protein
MSVCLSVCAHETTRLPLYGFSWNSILEDFSNIRQKNIQLRWQSDQTNRHFTRRSVHICEEISLNVQNEDSFRQSCANDLRKPTVYEIMWRYMVEPDRPQMGWGCWDGRLRESQGTVERCRWGASFTRAVELMQPRSSADRSSGIIHASRRFGRARGPFFNGWMSIS